MNCTNNNLSVTMKILKKWFPWSRIWSSTQIHSAAIYNISTEIKGRCVPHGKLVV